MINVNDKFINEYLKIIYQSSNPIGKILDEPYQKPKVQFLENSKFKDNKNTIQQKFNKLGTGQKLKKILQSLGDIMDQIYKDKDQKKTQGTPVDGTSQTPKPLTDGQTTEVNVKDETKNKN